jgi:cell division protease FtsH
MDKRKEFFSEEKAKKIDEEVKGIIQSCYEKAGTILASNLDKLHMMAESLLKYETIDQDQISDIMAGALPRDKSSDDKTQPKKTNPKQGNKPVQDS